MHLSMYYVSSFYFSIICLFMFMGLFACMFGVSSILFVGQRVRDIIVWYQSLGCSMGLNGP